MTCHSVSGSRQPERLEDASGTGALLVTTAFETSDLGVLVLSDTSREISGTEETVLGQQGVV